jgi:glycosyltransferase involved in cell wall biosynthesis
MRAGPLKDNLTTIPFGFDASHWYCDTPKEDVVITVAVYDTLRRIKIKGLDFFVEVATAMPEYTFVIVGGSPAGEAFLDKPENLKLLPRTPQPELRKLYSRAKVYAQFSITEGLPNAVIEAMFCECIPIGTDVGGMMDIIKDVGYMLDPRELDKAVSLISQAMADKSLGKRARESAIRRYPIDNRERAFKKLLNME